MPVVAQVRKGDRFDFFQRANFAQQQFFQFFEHKFSSVKLQYSAGN